MTDFLLELRSEEIPARMQGKARDDLARLFTAEIAKAGLTASAITTYATPRRLVLIATGLPLETAAVSEETKGPKVGAPPQAMEGFLRKTGLRADQLVERDGVHFAVVEKPGRATMDVLAEAVLSIISAFPWPKSMRWGAASRTTESLRWVRPLQGIVALLGSEVVPCEVDGIKSGSATMGHRFHHSGPVTIGNAADYAVKLRAAHVIVDQDERAAIIRDGAIALASEHGLSWIADEALVAENAGLTEWPVPLLGDFDPAFLAVPPEVIRLTLATNQKYFVCSDAGGALAPAFICTANIDAKDGGAGVIAGNRKVLSARLSDARFFWEQDKKTSLAVHAAKLSRITFHEKLGTVADKVERVAKLARWLVESGVISPLPLAGGVGGGQSIAEAEPTPNPSRKREGELLANLAETSARLCKADLVTEMVGEFPELQGIMGGYYARAEGLPDAVADAIRDHYKPVGQSDDVPTAPVTVAVSLADKLDTIAGFFAIDERPTGSKDPFALRRAAIGVASIVEKNHLRMGLFALLICHCGRLFWSEYDRLQRDDIAARLARMPEDAPIEARALAITMVQPEQYGSAPETPEAFAEMVETTINQINDLISFQTKLQLDRFGASILAGVAATLDFFADRLKVQQREAGVRHDLIDAVFALGGEDDLVRLLARVHALQAFVETPDGTNLLSAYKRAANLLKQAGDDTSPGRGGGPRSGGGVSSINAEPLHYPAAKALDGPPPRAGEVLEVEQALLTALTSAEPLAAAAIEGEDFAAAMTALASLRGPIDAFFDGVMVNDPDTGVRAFRLGLLTRFVDAVHKVADFSKIEG